MDRNHTRIVTGEQGPWTMGERPNEQNSLVEEVYQERPCWGSPNNNLLNQPVIQESRKSRNLTQCMCVQDPSSSVVAADGPIRFASSKNVTSGFGGDNGAKLIHHRRPRRATLIRQVRWRWQTGRIVSSKKNVTSSSVVTAELSLFMPCCCSLLSLLMSSCCLFLLIYP